MHRPWLNHYPAGVPAHVDTGEHASLVDLLDTSFQRHATRSAYKFMGRDFRYALVDTLSLAFAGHLQSLGLATGDRVAVMMPNVPQYPVVVSGILRAGLVVVNVNPLYTPRELRHQLADSGAKAIVLLENFAHTLQQVLHEVPTRHVVLAAVGDLLGPLKGTLANLVVRRVKKRVPPFVLPGAVRFNDAIARGRRAGFAPVAVSPDDIAVLQYTGGTTGLSKGATLLHRNLVANVLQCAAWYAPALSRIAPGVQMVTVCALPLYHIFGFTTNMMLGLRMGGCSLLVADPRDLPALFADLRRQPFHSLPAVNTLFNAMAQHPGCATVDWSSLVLSVGGGMAVQQATAQRWLEKTGCPIVEGYGLSETAPVATCNPVAAATAAGTIGMPLPDTEVVLLDDDGRAAAPGTRGEIAIRGPQVMIGYWQRPDETARAMTTDGFFRTGDIGEVDSRGCFRIVDRKKDMILVSGFNVYPNEVEDVVALLPGVFECAAVGVPDERQGEAVKLVVVRQDPALTEAQVKAWCDRHLTGYKRPRIVEFRTELPKTAVGKVLRRELRESAGRAPVAGERSGAAVS